MFINEIISFSTKNEEKNLDYYWDGGDNFNCGWGDDFFK